MRRASTGGEGTRAEARAAARLTAVPPLVPNAAALSGTRRPGRRQLQLRAQDALKAVDEWTREVLSPAPLDPTPSNTKELCEMLSGWRERGIAELASQRAAHRAAVKRIAEGSSELAADLKRLRSATRTEECDAAVTARQRIHQPNVVYQQLPAGPQVRPGTLGAPVPSEALAL